MYKFYDTGQRSQYRDEDYLKEINYRIKANLEKTKIRVLRPLLFFYVEQETNLLELKNFFTDRAISLFEHDGYIKILENES